jgi:hypothetical protein
MYKLEDHIKWYARKKDDFLQLVLDDRENKIGEILTKFILAMSSYINWEISDNVPQNYHQLDPNPEFRSVSL